MTIDFLSAGVGHVTAVSVGLDCVEDCTKSIPPFGTIALVAAAELGSHFVGWGGGCSGAASDCTIDVTAAVAVTATFAPDVTPAIWAVAGTGGVRDVAIAVAFAPDGDVLVMGYVDGGWSPAAVPNRRWIARYTSAGLPVWSRTDEATALYFGSDRSGARSDSATSRPTSGSGSAGSMASMKSGSAEGSSSSEA